jgi:hypothetical protein
MLVIPGKGMRLVDGERLPEVKPQKRDNAAALGRGPALNRMASG